ncbi:MAG: hypothetical protein JNJ73_21220 [Hyphomonadaceae bacterium]|nr:hypothetical protein [Hyphomonadaceae bacterium]
MQRSAIIAIAGGAVFVAALLAVVFFATGGGASASKSVPAPAADLRATTQVDSVTSAEANAWAEARAEDTASAYRVYLAAYPDGAFAEEARTAEDRLAAAAPAAKAKARVAPAPAPARQPAHYAEAPREPLVIRDIAGECRRYVDATLPQPSRVGRTVGGAAGGCAVGLLAGGDDGRNCAIGAIAGGATGAITAENRERRRRQEVDACIAGGGPPG